MADDTPSVEAVTAMLREAQAEIAALKRTIAAVRAENDLCGWEWRTPDGAGVCRLPRHADIHYVGTVDSHPFVERR